MWQDPGSSGSHGGPPDGFCNAGTTNEAPREHFNACHGMNAILAKNAAPASTRSSSFGAPPLAEGTVYSCRIHPGAYKCRHEVIVVRAFGRQSDHDAHGASRLLRAENARRFGTQQALAAEESPRGYCR
jgi:hypothetical protein